MSPGKILIVEDNEAIRETLETLLLGEGYEVLAACDGSEAVAILEDIKRRVQSPPCVVFLDLMMPVMNGWQFIAECQMRELIPGVPVVVVSAYGRRTTIDITQISFLHKPIRVEDLLDLAKQYCECATTEPCDISQSPEPQ